MTSAVGVNHWERLSGCVMYVLGTAGIICGDPNAGLNMDNINIVCGMDNPNVQFEVSDPNVGLGTDDSKAETNFSGTDSRDEQFVEKLIAIKSRDDEKNENSEGNFRQGSKKRVNFLPDGCLVQVREIPARINGSSSECEDSDSESTSASDDSDESDSSDSDEIESTAVSEPPLLEAARKTTDCLPTSDVIKLISGSQDATKRSKKLAAATIQLTEVQPPVFDPSPTQKRTKQKTYQKSHNRVQRKCRTKGDAPSLKSKQSRTAKTNTTRVSKSTKSNSSAVKNEANSKRRLLSRNIKNSPSNKQQTASGTPTPVSISLSILPAPNCANKDTTNNIDRMMQTLSVKQLYTTDDFTFPPQQAAANVRFPEILRNNKNRESVSQNGKIESIIQNGKQASKIVSFHKENVKTPIDFGPNHDHQHQHQHQHQHLPTNLFDNIRRNYTLQTARGNIDTAPSTPRIAQLWDSEQILSSHGFNSHSYPPASSPNNIFNNIKTL